MLINKINQNFMNNLYKKIYEAINNGIQRALILDDEDVSMNYQYKKVSNAVNCMDIYVKDFYDNIEWSKTKYNYSKNIYLQIVTTYENSGFTYKPENYAEFKHLINALQNVKGIKHENINYRWINMDGFVSCITADGSELPIQCADNNIKFLKFNFQPYYQSHIPGHPIIISTELPIIPCKWHIKNIENFNHTNCRQYTKHPDITQISQYDYNGYDNTYKNINIFCNGLNDFSNYPIFDLLSQYETAKFEAYIPAAGELLAIWENKSLIIGCLNMCRKDKVNKYFNHDKTYYYWTSTEHDYKSATCLKITGLTTRANSKHFTQYAFPIFKEKGND